ncbi:MAG TPA: site-specific DNA-methyltransferase [Planctomycetes bacterium]|nr:site-specific DNA-methyltransferase [Planctomycetota bacterium]
MIDSLEDLLVVREKPGAAFLFEEMEERRIETQRDEIQTPFGAVPRIAQELWTSRQRQGHSLHEISYRACFKGELPAFFLTHLTRPGDVVLDPFMGRGTTLVEAALRGRVPYGNDVNPLSKILCAPRLQPPTLSQVERRLEQYQKDLADPGPEEGDPELSVFFEAQTLGLIRALKTHFLTLEREGRGDGVDSWLRMVATNRLHGHSPGFFSVRSMPPNQAVSVETQKKLNARSGLRPTRKDVFGILYKKSRMLLRRLSPGERELLARVGSQALLLQGDSRGMEGVPRSSVALTVTSPPFLDVVHYARDNWLRCWFNGIDAERMAVEISTPSKLEDWLSLMGDVFAELFRVTRDGGYLVFEVGEVRKGTLLLEEPLLPVAFDRGWEILGVLINRQGFTKTANCWGVSNNKKGTNSNRMLVLRKPKGSRP